MSDGVINSKYGAHERNLDLSSEIVSHNKSLYVKQYRQAKSYRIKATQQYAVPTVVVDGNKYSSNAAVSQGTAYNDTTIKVAQNKYSNAAVSQGTAYNDTTIKVDQNKYSNAAVQQGTAYNDTTIKVDQNRYGSNAAVQQGTVYNDTTIRVDQNRYGSNAAVQQGTVYNDTTIRVDQNRYGSNAAVQQGTVYNDTTIRVDQNRYGSNAAVQQGTAYNDTTIRVDQNRYGSNAAVQQGTAYNDTTIRVDQNRYGSNAAVQQGTAYNDTTIRVDQNRYGSNAAVQQETTYSSPPVRVDQNRYSSNAAVQTGNNNILPAVAAIPTGSILFRRQLQYSSSKNRIISVLSTKKVTKKILKPVKRINQGISFVDTLQSYQNDVGSVDKVLTVGLNKADKLTTKVDKALTKKKKRKLATVKDKNVSKYATVTGAAKKLGKKGVSAVSIGADALVSVVGDDVGSQMVVQLVNSTRYAVKATKITGKTLKATAKTTKGVVKTSAKAVKKTAKATKTAAKVSAKATKAAVKVSTKVAQAAVKVTQQVVAAVTKAIVALLSNPIGLIIVGCVLLIVIIVFACGSFFGAFSSSSYSGAGSTDYSSSSSAVSTANNVSDVYDYVNKSIAERNLYLLNLQDSWTGFLKYDYEYQIEMSDGTLKHTSTYPVADCAPIMAYLAVNYQSYDLTDNIKNEIDNIVACLYTFDYKIDDYTFQEEHGSHTITYTGKKITFIVKYHNPENYFNSIIPDEKKANYASILQYGDRSYFRLYNILRDDNWHEYVGEQYGYSVEATYNSATYKYSYELKNNSKLMLNYKKGDGTTTVFLYSPLTGKIKSIKTDDDYDYIITLVDDKNKLEFTIYAEFEDLFTLKNGLTVGSSLKSGDCIASRRYPIYISCKSNGKTINPMLLMEYYQHAD